MKFFDGPSCAVMKHVNPSGAATADVVLDAYIQARDADPRAAFGSTIAFNSEVDEATAKEIMSSFVECVVAPSFTSEGLAVFTNPDVKMNKSIRILKCGNLTDLPRYTGEEETRHNTLKTLADGSVVMAAPLTTSRTRPPNPRWSSSPMTSASSGESSKSPSRRSSKRKAALRFSSSRSCKIVSSRWLP